MKNNTRHSTILILTTIILSVCTSLTTAVECVQLSATPWTVAHQASLFMGFYRQEYQNGLPFPSPGDLPEPGIEPRPPTLQADSLPSEPMARALNILPVSGAEYK